MSKNVNSLVVLRFEQVIFLSWLLACIVLSHLFLQYECFQHSLICCNITFRIRASGNRLQSNKCTFHKCFHSSRSQYLTTTP